ncbi:MAG: hypothetical protein RLZZ74_1369, partial [Cyanobacteriota bacterium]
MTINLTEKEAYEAMFAFLEQLYNRTKSDDIGGLLGGMSILPDGDTADPAIRYDWLECVSKA